VNSLVLPALFGISGAGKCHVWGSMPLPFPGGVFFEGAFIQSGIGKDDGGVADGSWQLAARSTGRQREAGLPQVETGLRKQPSSGFDA
jgi:hypothetical protein